LREVDKKESSKTEIAQAYGIPLFTLSTYLKNRDSIENQVKHSDLEDELFEWFCHARSSSIPAEGPVDKEQANEITLKMVIEFKVFKWLASAIQAAMEHHMGSH
jgi:hypothetical protein